MNKMLSILIIVLLVSCGGGVVKDHPVTEYYGWELVGQKGTCSIYYRIHDGHAVYWSVCLNSSHSSSVSK